MVKILLAEDDEIMRISVSDGLRQFNWNVDEAENGLVAKKLFDKNHYNIVISDVRMPEMDGISLLQHILKQNPDTDVVIMTAHGSVNDALECLRQGASEYILKPFDMDDLIIRVSRLLDTQAIRAKCELLEENCKDQHDKKLLGASLVMQQVHNTIEKVAATNATVLITGESGTGKELAARAIHKASSRSNKPFVSINCAAIPEGLIESELFGHEKGAFTGADKLRKGKFELANGGTLLMDELGDLPSPLQAKLLRVLQENSFERVGGNKTIDVNVRVIACTSKNLNKEVEKGNFRQDLLYRLQVIPLRMPSLREHMEDLEELCSQFIAEFNVQHDKSVSLTPKVFACLRQYDFPGNVRELRNILERALVLCHGSKISPTDLPEEIRRLDESDTLNFNLSKTIAKAEYRCLMDALIQTNGNRTEASKILGISRKNLWEKLKTHGIQ